MPSYTGTEGLVSVIMPTYNSEEFITDSINSVINQTYEKWELIIVDDCSKDKTVEIVEKIISIDSRIKLIRLATNKGAANARNSGIQLAAGEYIAFLDSDDIWMENKLDLQISFMVQNDYIFTCTYYDKIDWNSTSLSNIVKYPKEVTYQQLLYNCPGNSSVMYNANKISEKLYINPIRKRNDYLMWLNLIKKTQTLHCLDKVLMSHRVRNDSLSKNKSSLVKYHWIIYRNIEKLSFIKSVFLVTYWIGKTLLNLLIKRKNISA
ncbi:glycosyltransferase family 2 protein [Exiguobacterium sp. s55]|uniref:glycosyltransferase family 2 protein n=1 Tax=Exiguobacterium sp. s55 TaxID=2751245 RepID=UPI001BE9B21A|nr:glycosyltransferase family 2 protein [Exiguobacterium sp. s55]